MCTYLESLVLQHTLDGSVFPARGEFRVEDDTERAISDYFALRVGQIAGLAGEAILDSLADNFCTGTRSAQNRSPKKQARCKVRTTHSEAAERSRPVLRHHSAATTWGTSNRTSSPTVRRALVEHLVGGAWLACKGKR